MKIIIFILLIFTISMNQSNAITVINEVMYNPEGSDNNKEFIEIYSDEIYDFSDYIIEDSSSNDILKLVKSSNSSYSLIVEDGFDYSNIDASIYTVGATIGNDLNNDNDIIILRNNESKIIDLFSYFEDFGGDGKSLERILTNDYSNKIENWKESNLITGTPGYENSILETDYNNLFINEFLPDPIGNDDANIPDGEWIEIYNDNNEDIDLEGFFIEDDFGHKITISNTNTESTVIKENDFLLVYANSVSGFLNNGGFERIRLLYGNKVVDEISYSDSKEGLSWSKINNVWKLLDPSPSEENIDTTNPNKGYSSIKINKIYTGTDNSVSFGDEFEVRLEIYKGNTTKNAIEVWVEDNNQKISRITNFNVYGKFQNYTINIPILLNPNCNNKFSEGTYELIVEGINQKDKEDIEVRGFDKKLCNDDVKETASNKVETASVLLDKEDDPDEQVIQNSERLIQNKVIYESSDRKAKNLGDYILIIALLLIIIVILFRKDL